ncbi:prepilin peptidase [Pleionea sediminis]|uniref:prepilin peptidase n=1 Tax=Pleionea sediminis TaxID=2569479 RepID=UPI0011859657|nr:A24 family peptidase [Pleionea sediminis]
MTMDLGIYAYLLIIVSGIVGFFVSSRLVEWIPRKLYSEWELQLGEFQKYRLAPQNFILSVTHKVLIALITISIFAACLLMNGLSTETIGYLLLFSVLIIVASINFKHQVLPDILVIPMTWSGLLFHAYLAQSLSDYVYGAVVAYLIPYLIYQFIRLVTGKKVIGHADLKMFCLLGAWFGLAMVPSIFALFIFLVVLGIIFSMFKSEPGPMGTGWIYIVASLVTYFYGAIV